MNLTKSPSWFEFYLVSIKSTLRFHLVFVAFSEYINSGLKWTSTVDSLCPDISENMSGIPGVRPMFLKVELHKESKNGFKTINYRRYPVMIFFKKLIFGTKNHQKNWMFC